jgi:hypothetical protein
MSLWMAHFAAFDAKDESPCLSQSRSPFVFYLGSLHQVLFDFEFVFAYMVVHIGTATGLVHIFQNSLIIDFNFLMDGFRGKRDK